MRTAADQGDFGSHFILGVMYDQGQGVPQDFVEAYKWVNLAASREMGEGERIVYAGLRDEVAEQMTPTQVAEAQQRASEWVAAFEQRGGT